MAGHLASTFLTVGEVLSNSGQLIPARLHCGDISALTALLHPFQLLSHLPATANLPQAFWALLSLG